jgi:dolichyl-diphosphooligosaccharide--protein glycosyltransferase
MIPVTPLILLGIWSLVGPSRFAMYLAPFIGVGAGVLIELLVKFAGEKIGFRPPWVALASVSLMVVPFFFTAGHTRYDKQTAPIMSAATTKALLDIKRIVPRHSAMFTPFWEFGYPLMEIGDFATYHDGACTADIITYLNRLDYIIKDPFNISAPFIEREYGDILCVPGELKTTS